MSDPIPPPPPPSPTSPSPPLPPAGTGVAPRKPGCGRGCLMGCLVTVVVLVLVLVAGLTVARPVLDARWKQWRAENPWAGVVLGAASVAKDMVGDKTGADTAAGGGRAPARRMEGVDDKSAMPPDLPLWPRARAETYSVGQGHAAGYQRVRERSDSVLRYYRKTMPEKGWQLTAEREGAGAVLLLYRKAGRTARVEIVADTGMTEIWVRSRAPEKR